MLFLYWVWLHDYVPLICMKITPKFMSFCSNARAPLRRHLVCKVHYIFFNQLSSFFHILMINCKAKRIFACLKQINITKLVIKDSIFVTSKYKADDCKFKHFDNFINYWMWNLTVRYANDKHRRVFVPFKNLRKVIDISTQCYSFGSQSAIQHGEL